MEVKLIISPPFINSNEYLNNNKDSFVTTPKELSKLIENNETKSLNEFKSIVVLNLDGTSKEREDVINQLKYVFDKIDYKHVIIDISQPKLLYKMYLNNNMNLLPSYLYYDCLEKPNNNVEFIEIETDYDKFKNGSAGVIVDIHCLLVNSNGTRIMLNLPSAEDSISVNQEMINYLRKMSELGYLVILSHCEENKYEDIKFSNLVNIYDKIFSQISDLDIAGFCVSANKNSEIVFPKPHPWHLFKIFKDFNINPKKSFYLGYQTIDKKFSDFSGIEHYIDCSSTKRIEILNKIISES